MIGYGIDLSHHQAPDALPWETYRGRVDAVIVRATNGTTLDRESTRHTAKARGIGATFGLYTFFRHEQAVADQFAALRVIADACRLGPGDIVPALDIEDDPPNHSLIDPSWAAKAEELAGHIVDEWGGCIVYVTQRDWGRLGKPEWVLHLPLWVAHYTAAAKPASPAGMAPVLWQHRVGPFNPLGPGGVFAVLPGNPQVDQSRILAPLPLVGSRVTEEDRVKVAQLVALSLADEARNIDQEAETDPAPPPDEVA
jgi:hypothetical protein